MAPRRPFALESLVAIVAVAHLAAARAGEVAVDELVPALFPRYMLGSPPRLAERQAVFSCRPGESACLAINSTGCCPDSNYCYVNPQGQAKCCAAGSRCDDPCPISEYRCTVSSTASCCLRPCPAPSGYQCPQSLGGACCSVGSACLSGNSCSSTINTATVNTVSASPTGCTTGQFSCPASAGGGCCNEGQSCTTLATNLFCAGGSGASSTGRATRAGGSAGPTATGPAPASTDQGLSSGAKAGIGVGVTLGVLVLAGLVAWFVVARRRHARAQSEKPAQAAPGGGMSDVSSPGGGGSTGADYFGPHPTPGPFTEGHSAVASASGMAPAYSPYSPGAGGGREGAVPLTPQSPGDITTPVEIAEGGSPGSGGRSPQAARDYFTPKQSPEPGPGESRRTTGPATSPLRAELP
ncbi:MAG: hypothetical protein M1832_001015 [Thelocarpon impressellum]|nr:MAG: hypothetical protein M1832_001015 [Thelocarpon impressellum]